MSRHRNHFDVDSSDDDLGIEIEQQSDSDIAPSTVHTPPPAPKGLVISKLGVQATTGDGIATGLFCLKLRSIPALYPLPISPTLIDNKNSNLKIATQLLGLSPALGDPGNSIPSKPYIDVSATTGQVYVVLDPVASNGTPRRRSSVGSRMGGRTEWLVAVEFEVPIEKGMENLFRIPVPRCLDSMIRFHVLPGDDDNMEVNIAIEPKVLPFSAPVGRNRMPPSPTKKGRVDQGVWGESNGMGEDDDSDDGIGSWLEGRFQRWATDTNFNWADRSTDSLFIEWALVPSVGSPPDLRITPAWGHSQPTIGLSFETTLAPGPSVMSIGAVLPQNWGWQELEIRGDGLLGWRSSGESSGVLASAASPHSGADPDSTATLDQFQDLHGLSTPPPDHRVALADLEPDDFSFELNSIRADSRSRPVTPSLRRSITAELAQAAMFKVRPRAPVHASSFELEFEDDGEEEDRVIIVKGVLAPLPLTLVPPEADMDIPFIRFLDPSLPTRSAVVCPQATFRPGSSEEVTGAAGTRLCDVWKPSIGTFSWGDEARSKQTEATVHGPVKVVVQRRFWGVQTVALAFQWPVDAHDIKFNLPTKTARVVRATALGRQIARSITQHGGEAQVRLAGGRGIVEAVLEAVDAEGVALPLFPGADGEVAIELVGPGWDRILNVEPKTNLKRIDAMTFTGDLTPPPSISFTPPPILNSATETKVVEKIEVPPARGRWRRIVSFSTLFNLFLLYVLVSLAQQVQRLRNEVQFIADEQRDLRLHGFDRVPTARGWVERESRPNWEESAVASEAPPTEEETEVIKESQPDIRSTAGQGTTLGSVPEPTRINSDATHQTQSAGSHSGVSVSNPNYGLGRVVLTRSSWKDWINHPTVQKVASTLAKLWHTISWLLL